MENNYEGVTNGVRPNEIDRSEDRGVKLAIAQPSTVKRARIDLRVRLRPTNLSRDTNLIFTQDMKSKRPAFLSSGAKRKWRSWEILCRRRVAVSAKGMYVVVSVIFSPSLERL